MILRREWTQQPPPGWPVRKDGIGAGLVFAQVGNLPVDLARGSRGVRAGSEPVVAVGPNGKAFGFTANGGTNRIDYACAPTLYPKSYASVFFASAGTDTFEYLVYRCANGGDSATLNSLFGLVKDSSNYRLQLSFNLGGFSRSSTFVPMDIWNVASASFPANELTASQMVMFINGIQTSFSTATNATSTSGSLGTSANITTHSRRDSGRQLKGYTALNLAWDRVLTPAEHLAFNMNPWCVFEPAELLLPYSTGRTGYPKVFIGGVPVTGIPKVRQGGAFLPAKMGAFVDGAFVLSK